MRQLFGNNGNFISHVKTSSLARLRLGKGQELEYRKNSFGIKVFLILFEFRRLGDGLKVILFNSNYNQSSGSIVGSIRPEVFSEKCVLKICSKFTVGHPGRSVILTKLLCNFIEIALRQGCSSKFPFLDGCFCVVFSSEFLRRQIIHYMYVYVFP